MKSFACLCFALIINISLSAQVRVIADMDIDSDVDDVAALAMLNNMHRAGKIKLLGVVVTSDEPYAAACTDAINRYFNPTGFPVGVLKNQQGLKNYSRYTRQISQEFPHKLASDSAAMDATMLYRKLLAASPDSSVTIITIGHLTNFQNLLKSGPDATSRLNGIMLANKKISKWFCMGGQFPEGKEANFYRPDPASTLYCLNVWTKEVVFAGWEIGEKIKTGGEYLKSKLDASSPVYRAYQLYNDFKGRSSWDQVAVFLLLKQSDKYFERIQNGYCQVSADGSNKWMTDHDSNHSYLRFWDNMSYDEISKLMDDMVLK